MRDSKSIRISTEGKPFSPRDFDRTQWGLSLHSLVACARAALASEDLAPGSKGRAAGSLFAAACAERRHLFFGAGRAA